jgi:hypothetical protein
MIFVPPEPLVQVTVERENGSIGTIFVGLSTDVEGEKHPLILLSLLTFSIIVILIKLQNLSRIVIARLFGRCNGIKIVGLRCLFTAVGTIIEKRTNSKISFLASPLKLEQRSKNRKIAVALPWTAPIVDKRPEGKNGTFLISSAKFIGKKRRGPCYKNQEKSQDSFNRHIHISFITWKGIREQLFSTRGE